MKNKIIAFAILAVGLFLSVALHESLHVLLHLGDIIRVDIFPSNGNIVQVVADLEPGYNVALEEAFAYGITIAVMLITFVAFLLKVTEKRKV